MEKREETIKCKIDNFNNLSLESRNKLIEHYMPLAKKIAKKYYGLGVDDEDILMSAYEGLIYALNMCGKKKLKNLLKNLEDKIDEYVRQQIINLLGFRTVIKNSDNEAKNILIELKMLIKELARKPSEEELLQNYSHKKLTQYIFRLESITESLDSSFTTYEKLDSVKNGILDVESNLSYEELIAFLPRILEKSKLTEIEKYVIIHKYLKGEKTKEISSSLSNSVQCILATENRALAKLRRRYLKYFLDLAKTLDGSTRIDVRGLTFKKRSNN